MRCATRCAFVLLALIGRARSEGAQAKCFSAQDCSLNGECVGGSCVCYAPWSSSDGDEVGCGRLNELPGPRVGMYGQSPHVPSWGGNAILHKDQWHLFVSEMADNCGLAQWGGHMDVAHAVSPNVTGPYVKLDTALPVQATNPQAIVDSTGTWWLFHIGTADSSPNRPNCSSGPPSPPSGIIPAAPCDAFGNVEGYTCVQGHCGGPADPPGSINCAPTITEPTLAHSCGTDYNSSAGKAALSACVRDAAKACSANSACHAFSLDPKQWSASKAKMFGTDAVVANPGWNTWTKNSAQSAGADSKATSSQLRDPHTKQQTVPPGVLHKASGPDGPWSAVPLPFGCNNPAPGVATNGSYVVLVCTWSAHKALSFSGPWSTSTPIHTPGTSPRLPGVALTWEDPYIWQDKRGHWHLLAHVYTLTPYAPNNINPISGHGFSVDGVTWNLTSVEPYSYNVTYDDGTHATVATRERPKLIFDPSTGEPSHLVTAVSPQWPCTPCPHGGACIDCKVTAPFDKQVFTMIRPLQQASNQV